MSKALDPKDTCVLVTGGAGFIGANFVYLQLQEHPEDRIVCLDKLTYAGNLETLAEAMKNPQFRFVKADICDREAVDKLFAEEHPEAVAEFLSCHAASVEAVNAAPADWAQAVVDAGIVDNATIAEKAIPGCMLVCQTGKDMKAALGGYLQVLADADASAVGGKLPADDFYYME